MFSYIAYGLGIHSTVPLPELETGGEVADVAVHLSSIDFSPPSLPEELHYYYSAEAVYLCRKDIGTALVREGREIILNPVADAKEQTIRLLILGPALAVLLHQRGLLVLHASTVKIAGTAVAFMGGSGRGKSTTAAALYARGHSIVADDVTAVRADSGTGLPEVLPGFPQLKLWPEAAASSLGDVPETLPQIHPDLEKRARRVSREFSSDLVPLSHVYVLDEGESHGIEPLRPQDALLELINHSFCAGLLPGVGASSHFRLCANVINNVSISSLKRCRSLSALPDLARIVEEEALLPTASGDQA